MIPILHPGFRNCSIRRIYMETLHFLFDDALLDPVYYFPCWESLRSSGGNDFGQYTVDEVPIPGWVPRRYFVGNKKVTGRFSSYRGIVATVFDLLLQPARCIVMHSSQQTRWTQIGPWIAKQKRIPFIPVFCDAMHLTGADRGWPAEKTARYRKQFDYLCKRADAAIVISSEFARLLRTEYGIRDTIVIPHVPTGDAPETEVNKVRPYFVYSDGILDDEDTEIDFVLESYAVFQRRFGDSVCPSLMLIGPATHVTQARVYQKAAFLGIRRGTVEFHGSILDRDLYLRLLGGALAGLVPILGSVGAPYGFRAKILDYAEARVPIIACGKQESFELTGTISRNSNPNEWAEVMRSLVVEPIKDGKAVDRLSAIREDLVNPLRNFMNAVCEDSR